MSRLFLVGLVLFFFLSIGGIQGQAISQQRVTIKPGDRIRLKIEGGSYLTGKYDRFTGDSVALRLGKSYNSIIMIVPKYKIINLDVSQKTLFTPLQKILMGTLIGATAGALFGLVVPDSPTLDNGGFYYWSRGGTIMLWGAIGAGSGLIFGIGETAIRPERWTPAEIPGMPLDYHTGITNISIGWRIVFGN